MNLNELRVKDEEDGWLGLRQPSESELLGLAVQLLKQRGAIEVESLRLDDWGGDVVSVDNPGRYLVVPLEALEDE